MQFDTDAIGIIGASGFVGRALVQDLIADTEDRPRLFGRRKSTVSGCPVEELTTKPGSFDGLRCVVHLAAITNSRAPEDELERANVEFAGEVTKAAAQAGVRRFVFVSSLAVYGRTVPQPIVPETHFNPANAYGRSKISAEALLRKIADESGMELVILRPPMVYGAGSKGNFSLLARLIQMGLPLPFGSAKAQRSFCSIGNLVSAIRHAMFRAEPGSMLIPADPDDVDTATLVTRMAEMMERPLRLVPVSKRLVAWPLAALGRAEMATSIFEPFRGERTHWKQIG